MLPLPPRVAESFSSDTKPIVETQYGKVRGSIRNGVFTFKGIPYGADTGGANRWMMAKKPTPWAGVRSSTCYTHTCPSVFRAGWNHDEERFIYDWSDGVPGEDMLSVAVWTPGVNDNKKRPVLVWIHGGGYAAGSNEELKSYDGERLARRGDIIVVGLNHRLNILGFLNLEKCGDQYKNSQNVSQLDLVSGLQWIKDNIANFGGDPDAVTIFGQSGGGGKVTYLMGMPSAKGLFPLCGDGERLAASSVHAGAVRRLLRTRSRGTRRKLRSGPHQASPDVLRTVTRGHAGGKSTCRGPVVSSCTCSTRQVPAPSWRRRRSLPAFYRSRSSPSCRSIPTPLP